MFINIDLQTTSEKNMTIQEIKFIDNTKIKKTIDNYNSITVSSDKIIKSWKESLFSYEWLLPDGRIKSIEELSNPDQLKRKEIEKQIINNKSIEKPVLGIGILDNIEIGIGKEILLTLAANNIKNIQVHTPNTYSHEFDKFLS